MIFGTHNGESYDLSEDDWRRHCYIVGATRSGKTTLLLNLMNDAIRRGEGLIYLDPHGDAAGELLALIPPRRADDLILLDLGYLTRSVAWNPLHNVPEDDHARVADGLVSAMRHVWRQSWGPRMEYVLVNFVRTEIAAHGSLFGVLHLSTNAAYRARRKLKARDPAVRLFWNVFDQLDDRRRDEWLSPVINKVGALFGSPYVRNVLAQDRSKLDITPLNLRRAVDEKAIIVVNLSKGAIGEENAHLFGALFVAEIVNAALSRADSPVDNREPANLFVDEFQSFASTVFDTGLSEGGKYGLTICAANQFTGQLDERLRNSVFGNVGNVVSFRVGPNDAAELAPLFGLHEPVTSVDPARSDSALHDFCDKGLHTPRALTEQHSYHAWARMLKDGHPRLLQLDTLPPPPSSSRRVAEMVEHNHKKFGTRRALVEASINSLPKPPGRTARKWN